MTFPANGPATLALVKAHLNITDTDDDDALTLTVRAVNAQVISWPVAAPADGAADWTGDALAPLVLGSVMLAARLFKRRATPDGVAAFNDAGPAYVSRNDPDVAQLLQLGAMSKPQIG